MLLLELNAPKLIHTYNHWSKKEKVVIFNSFLTKTSVIIFYVCCLLFIKNKKITLNGYPEYIPAEINQRVLRRAILG